MSLTFEKPSPLDVLDAVIADMRASGDTGHVENLLQARADIADLAKQARRCVDGVGDLNDLREVVARFRDAA